MLLNEIRPGPSLARYIRLYRIIDFHFADATSIPPKFYSPRPEHCLQFYPKDTETVSYPTQQTSIANKRATLTGQHTILQCRQVGKTFLSFQVVFQPTALHQLTGINLAELANVYTDAEDLFGSDTRLVNEQLSEATSYPQMVQIVERFLTGLIKKAGKQERSIDRSAMMMLSEEEHFKLDSFLKQSHLCHRQFDRTFKERVGIAPKQFLQIIRFDKAFRLKNRYPQLDWLSVALRCGYHDYQHLVKDYKNFTGYTPTQFFAIDNNAPERVFGEAEV
ncbi:MAG: helix-turn-helix domain-containing protein [Chitinophagaceae bacterium]